MQYVSFHHSIASSFGLMAALVISCAPKQSASPETASAADPLTEARASADLTASNSNNTPVGADETDLPFDDLNSQRFHIRVAQPGPNEGAAGKFLVFETGTPDVVGLVTDGTGTSDDLWKIQVVDSRDPRNMIVTLFNQNGTQLVADPWVENFVFLTRDTSTIEAKYRNFVLQGIDVDPIASDSDQFRIATNAFSQPVYITTTNDIAVETLTDNVDDAATFTLLAEGAATAAAPAARATRTTSCTEDTASSSTLLTTYAPEVRLHPKEEYFPSSVDWYLKKAFLFQCKQSFTPACKLVETHPTSSTLGTFSTNDSQNFLAECGILDDDFASCLSDNGLSKVRKGEKSALETPNPPVSYGHVIDCDGYTDLQYWLFYPYDKAIGPFGIGWFVSMEWSHVGDWEHVTVRIDDEQNVLGVFLSAHGKSESKWYGFDELTKASDTHPIVYSAQGTHANYRNSGKQPRSKRPDDHTGKGKKWKTWKSMVKVASSQIINDQSWVTYSGRWGETSTLLGEESPRSPVDKSEWLDGDPGGPKPNEP